MKFTKTIARKFIFPILTYLKVDTVIRTFNNSNHLNIMYHGVVEKDSTKFSPRHITKEQFERQLIYFKNNFEIISMSEAFYRKK